jgi:hypothetical protein
MTDLQFLELKRGVEAMQLSQSLSSDLIVQLQARLLALAQLKLTPEEMMKFESLSRENTQKLREETSQLHRLLLDQQMKDLN